MKFFAALTAALFLAGGAAVQAGTWKVDKTHSTVGFAVSHLVISETTGEFSDYDVTVESSKDDFTDAKINVSIKVNSIDTDDEKRDGHLKSPDFFDAESHPEITFTGKQLKKVSKNKYTLTGDLTIRGKTKTVTLDVKYGGMVKDPWGNTRAGFKISGEIDRQYFGVSWNKTLDAGGVVVGDMVEIDIDLELIKQA